MRVLVIGASGAIGTRLVPKLREGGHEVIGSSRSPDKAEGLRALGARGIVLDALDSSAVRNAIEDGRPEAIIYEATALADLSDFKHFDRSFAATNRLRTVGTDNVLVAAKEGGIRRVIAQSYADHRYARVGGPVKDEEDALDQRPPSAMRETLASMAHLDEVVTKAGGVVLRYGSFYGDPNPFVAAVRARKWPIVGDGGGVWSFIHLEDAASATVLALERGSSGVYNVVDDEPAPTRVWLTELARILGAKPPLHWPRLPARLFAGEAQVVMSTESRGASNAKAKRELGWSLRYPSWRQGFVAAYGQPQSQRAA